MKIKKGDTIKILTGKDRNKTGKVAKIFPEKNKVLVDGYNLYKKHIRPKKQGEKGQIIEVSRPLDASNVRLVCPSCKKSTRVGYKIEAEKKFRICKNCKHNI